MRSLVRSLVNIPYIHLPIAFFAGASLELFMNFFYIGEANIYRSIEKNMSDSIAENKFLMEKQIFEELLSENNETTSVINKVQ